MNIDILNGDCLDMMATIPDESVDCVITSPPYWGLRDYGGEGRVWGAPECVGRGEGDTSHEWEGYTRPSENTRNNDNSLQLKSAYWEPQEQAFCKHCDAWFGQLGLEPTPEQYTKNMVEIFREVRRILKPKGTLWLNLGDSYCAGTRKNTTPQTMHDGNARDTPLNQRNQASGVLKNKDLVGIPWRVAFALQADGWWLRQDIIWAKPNCMPESVKDRCTKNHEYIFLLTKEADYFYDNEAIKTPTGANKRSVWWVGPKPFPEAHFAVFPIELIEPCILAGTSAHGNCADCGAPWKRSLVRLHSTRDGPTASGWREAGNDHTAVKRVGESLCKTTGWEATCECNAEVVPATVFDPFGGSGTTGIAAIKHGRNAILTELSEKYVSIAEARIASFRAETGMDKAEVEWI